MRGARDPSGLEKINGFHYRPECSEKALLARPHRHAKPLALCKAGRRVYRDPLRVATSHEIKNPSGALSADRRDQPSRHLICVEAIRVDNNDPLAAFKRRILTG